MDMMMMTQMILLQQQISGSNRAIAPAAAAPVLSNTDTTTAARPRQLNIPEISLAQFCTRYRIEEKERVRLEKMEFHLDDPLDDLGTSDFFYFTFSNVSPSLVLCVHHILHSLHCVFYSIQVSLTTTCMFEQFSAISAVVQPTESKRTRIRSSAFPQGPLPRRCAFHVLKDSSKGLKSGE
jgi:hypothetical protein